MIEAQVFFTFSFTLNLRVFDYFKRSIAKVLYFSANYGTTNNSFFYKKFIKK